MHMKKGPPPYVGMPPSRMVHPALTEAERRLKTILVLLGVIERLSL